MSQVAAGHLNGYVKNNTYQKLSYNHLGSKLIHIANTSQVSDMCNLDVCGIKVIGDRSNNVFNID